VISGYGRIIDPQDVVWLTANGYGAGGKRYFLYDLVVKFEKQFRHCPSSKMRNLETQPP
jgi:hypothetical protein